MSLRYPGYPQEVPNIPGMSWTSSGAPRDISQDFMSWRYVEIENSSESTTSKKRSCKFEVLTQSSHYDGPLPDGCENPQYKIVNYSDFKLKVDSLADNCCGLVNGEIILVKNIVYDSRKGILVLTGNEYEEKNNFYTEPCDSSSLDIWSVGKLSELKTWPLEDVRQKYVRLPYGSNNFAVFPMLHVELN
ncbi:uncharacterized protein LOC124308921 [Neodiprion virginianus]|uniref:uncharacterized protein LOC124308921 n=1 Tax=Neodiprion virginianus TaxID=2961670 RepID=UPI001EE69FDA|nr:uncharacterized protein LOC124308921 [Neodiprion virginianus]